MYLLRDETAPSGSSLFQQVTNGSFLYASGEQVQKVPEHIFLISFRVEFTDASIP